MSEQEPERAPVEDGLVEEVVRRVRPPISLAAAILYPERQVQEWRWRDEVPLRQVVLPPYAAESKFNDVWNSDADLCGYCAAEVGENEARCPRCRRPLKETAWRFTGQDSRLAFYSALLLGTGQLFLVYLLLEAIQQQALAQVVFHGGLSVALLVGALLVGRRWLWAYLASVMVVLLAGLALMLDVTGRPSTAVSASTEGVGLFLALAEAAPALISGPLLPIIQVLLAAVLTLALGYGLFEIGVDYQRRSVWHIAHLTRGLQAADQYYLAGQQFAQAKLWATAIVHYRRATAEEPGRLPYQKALGQAYAEIGFYERSLDTLTTARQLAGDRPIAAELAQLIQSVQARAQQRPNT